MPNKYFVELETGHLEVTVAATQQPLNELLTFGSRQNPKRRYLFISRVLGKYVPCRPAVMRKSYKQLAGEAIKAGLQGKTWVLGVAETATALGAGVAQEIHASGIDDVIYSHTTRYELPRNVSFSIKEAHSHAPSHLVYELDASLQSANAETVVIVDDEISTGKTLNQLTHELREKLPLLKKVVWTSLVNWLSPEEYDQFQRSHPDIELAFSHLLSGSYSFAENAELSVGLPDKTASSICQFNSGGESARTGYNVTDIPSCSEFVDALNVPLRVDTFDRDKKYTVIGTGEFTHQPFLFAEKMAQAGLDVVVQSTGRSPVLEGCGVERKESFFDTAHDGVFYLYNRSLDRHPIILYETQEQYKRCELRAAIHAQAGILAKNKKGPM